MTDIVTMLDPPENLALANSLLRLDRDTGDLIIQNGKSRLVLCQDGSIWIEGCSIRMSAKSSIGLNAAFIELN